MAVKWLGWPEKFNSWVFAKEVVDVQQSLVEGADKYTLKA